jgi:hypothetical protein
MSDADIMGFLLALGSIVVLAAHLLAMNVPSAAPFVCVWLHARGRRGDAAANAVGRQLARASLWSLLCGAVLGIVLVGLMWAAEARGYWHAVQRFPSSAYVFALSELMFSAICLTFYVALWDRWQRRPWLHAVLAVVGTSNLLYHFPPLMIALGNLASRPELVQEPVITRPVFRELLLQPILVAQVLHFIVASAAVAGVVLMLVAGRKGTVAERSDTDRLVVIGARIALAASLIQLAVGGWVLVQLPSMARSALLGDDWTGTAFFLLSVLAAVGVLHSLASVAIGDTRDVYVRRAAVLMLVVVLLMTGTLFRTRRIEASINQLELASTANQG